MIILQKIENVLKVSYEGLSISKITLDRKEINWVVNQS